ncbi:GNAT family N-acetyltransferase [Streptomyces sp. NPDC006553]|uniref:GNAT family N-acetyltransferase n=1 Tax=unclassified Streptomyces TaxID=2593676 RepID=UPI0022518101|nr:GNAT family N-acetyltransferase [Streptomyces sp. NBC_00233]MCX5229647.1 GNAT family N-acetyltransferase [Streptomyces sp. NBC_00233]
MNATVLLEAPATPTAPALLLRPWSVDDVAALVASHRDPELRRRAPSPMETEGDGLAWVRAQEEGWAEGVRFGFAVFETPLDAAASRLVGNVALKELAPGRPSAEVGYWTAARARGRGVAPRALEALTAWAFDSFRADGLERLELLHQADNTASCRVAEKCGYAFDRILPAAPPAFPLDGHLHVRERS